MNYSHLRLKLLLCLFVLTPIACGIQAAPAVVANYQPTAEAVNEIPTAQVKYTRGEVCDSGGLNVRSEPGLDAPVIATKEDGDAVTLTGDIKLKDGVLWLRIGGGWVSGKYICIGE